MDARHRHAALKIDNLSVVANIGADLLVGTYCNDDAVVYRRGLCPTALTINGINAAFEHDEVCGILLRPFRTGRENR